MNKVKTDLLVTTFLHLYKHRQHFECDDGWFELIWDLSFQLEKLIIAQMDSQQLEVKENFCFCNDVKEKRGSLRFYMSYATDQMQEHIEIAEKASEKICEVCGEPGKLRPGAWSFTRCDECWVKPHKGKKSSWEKNEKK